MRNNPRKTSTKAKQLELFCTKEFELREDRFYIFKPGEGGYLGEWLNRKLVFDTNRRDAKPYKKGAVKAAEHQLSYRKGCKNLQVLEKVGKQWYLHKRIKNPTIWKAGVWAREPISL